MFSNIAANSTIFNDDVVKFFLKKILTPDDYNNCFNKVGNIGYMGYKKF